MKRFTPIYMAGILASLGVMGILRAQEPIALLPNDRIAICGDAGQFSRQVGGYLATSQAQRYDVIGGASGRIGDLIDPKLDNMDLLLFPKPTVVVLIYGTRSAELAKSSPDLLDRYRQGLVSAIQKLKASGVRLVILTSPTAVDPDSLKQFSLPISYEDFNNTLSDINKVTLEVAAEQNAGYVDLMTPMLETIKKVKAAFGPTYLMTMPDIIYPSTNAGPILSYALLKAFHVDGNIGAITLDMANGTATGTDGQKIISSDKSKIEIESTRYPFSFMYDPGDPKDPKDWRSSVPYTPFNQELNRYMLTVKNIPNGKWKVTWNDATKDFSSEDLKKGINLSEEFLYNPFSKPVWSVINAMQERGIFVGYSVGALGAEIKNVETTIPGSKEACDNLHAVIQAQWEVIKNLKSMEPVRSTITITPAS